MMKAWLIALILSVPVGLVAQHRIAHQLRFDPKQQTLSGQSTLAFSAERYTDSLYLHLPSRALEWKESYLHRQVADFQRVDIYYADSAARGALQIFEIKLNGQPIQACQQCEFVGIALPETAGDSVKLTLNYQMTLPNAEFIGIGQEGGKLRLIDWLPRVAMRDSSGWKKYPVDFFSDVYLPRDQFQLELSLPLPYQVVCNLPQAGKTIIDQQGQQVWQYAGESRNLQFFASPGLTSFPLEGGKSVFLEAESLLLRQHLQKNWHRLSEFFYRELADSLNDIRNIIYLEDKKGEYQSAKLLSLELPASEFEMSRDLAQARAEAHFRYQLHPDGYAHPWLARGLPYYYKYHFIRSEFPEERWIPFGNSLLGRLLALDDFDYAYQNQFLYLFLARQGLDQKISSPADSLSRLNYEAVAQAKTFLAFDHLRAYLGERNFKRSMARYRLEASPSQPVNPNDLEAAFNYYSVKPTDWFFSKMLTSAEIYDYQLLDVDHCPTVTTATIVNKGKMAIPYSVTGYKDGQAVLTEWFSGHMGSRSVQLYQEEYDKVVVNAHSSGAEYSQKNNRYYDNWILERAEPLSLAFYNSFEKPDASQIFYVPTLSYNAYDKFLPGLLLSNSSVLVKKPWEWQLNPNYSTGTGRLTGSASLLNNCTLPKNNFFRQISSGIFARYYHYDRNLSFFRLSPGLNLRIRKPYPKSPLIQNIKLRGVRVSRELAPQSSDEFRQNLASYSVFNANYRLENTNIFRPTIFEFDFEYADKFSKVYASWDQRLMLPNRKWMILRLFGGLMLKNRYLEQGREDNFYSFGLSGTPDYLFDYYFIGRSDVSGLWSQQFFTSEGGFKSGTAVFADRWMTTANLALPIYSVFGLFGDVGLADGTTYWDYGVRLALVTDFVEVYFPFQNSQQNFLQQENYSENIRFVLDLDLGNIMNRIRRGFY